MLRTIGDYEVREIDRVGAIVRYEATHIVLPRRAVVELLELEAPRVDAMKLMRRACILEALHHPAVPRVFECGRLDGRPWIATSDERNRTLANELEERRLDVSEVLAVLEEVGAVLSHAHSRGVLHGNICPAAIVRTPRLELLKWENARLHDTELMSDAIDGREDVFALGKLGYAALDKPEEMPDALKQLFARMLAPDYGRRPSASEVVAEVRALRKALDADPEVDLVIEALADEDDEPDIEIEDPNVEGDCILLERHHMKRVIADVVAAIGD